MPFWGVGPSQSHDVDYSIFRYEGMVGYIVHYWEPNHPNHHFRSNFNRTVFLIQIGDNFVPVSENGVKEYNTIGTDERIRIVHIPKNELRLVDPEIYKTNDDGDAGGNDDDADQDNEGAVVEGECGIGDGNNSNNLGEETIPDDPNEPNFSEEGDDYWANQDESNKARNLPMNK